MATLKTKNKKVRYGKSGARHMGEMGWVGESTHVEEGGEAAEAHCLCLAQLDAHAANLHLSVGTSVVLNRPTLADDAKITCRDRITDV